MLKLQPCRVGFFESSGEAADLLLRAVSDLYARWLSDAGYWKQAQAVYEQQKSDFIGRTGEAFGSVVKQLSSVGGKPSAAVGSLIKEAFEGLASINRDLTNPMGELAHLQIEQARELLELVHKITRQPLVLVFDQWEKSPGLQTESNILDSFLRHVSEWPPCHIFVGARPNEQVLKTWERFEKSFPEARVHNLPLMHLDSLASRSGLIDFLRQRVPSSSAIPDGDLLKLISGYPGTVSRWTHRDIASGLRTRDDFLLEAKNAEMNRFPEFEDILSNLAEQSRLLSIRLALLPQTGDPDAWTALSQIILEGVSPRQLDELRRSRVLESVSPPSYGHAKRTEAALRWFQDNCPYEIREVCETLIYRVASQVRDLSTRVFPYVSCLVELNSQSVAMRLSHLAQAFCISGQSLVGVSPHPPNVFLGSATECRKFAPSSAALLAMGLFNTLIDAKQEETLERRDALLEELRQLHAAFPDDPFLVAVIAAIPLTDSEGS